MQSSAVKKSQIDEAWNPLPADTHVVGVIRLLLRVDDVTLPVVPQPGLMDDPDQEGRASARVAQRRLQVAQQRDARH